MSMVEIIGAAAGVAAMGLKTAALVVAGAFVGNLMLGLVGKFFPQIGGLGKWALAVVCAAGAVFTASMGGLLGLLPLLLTGGLIAAFISIVNEFLTPFLGAVQEKVQGVIA